MKKVKEKEWIDATGKYFPERKKGKESCKCGHERERHKSKYHMITCEICECDDYTPSGKDSAGKTKNREVGCKQQAPEDGNLSNAPLKPSCAECGHNTGNREDGMCECGKFKRHLGIAGAKGVGMERQPHQLSVHEHDGDYPPRHVAPAKPAPLTPFEKWLRVSIKVENTEGRCVCSKEVVEHAIDLLQIVARKHRELCHPIDAEKLAEWLFLNVDSWDFSHDYLYANVDEMVKANCLEKAKEAINHARRKP